MKRVRLCILVLLLGVTTQGAHAAPHAETNAHSAEGHESADKPLRWQDINWVRWGDMDRPPLAFVLVNFGLFVWLLRRTAVRAGKQMIRERHEHIRSAVEQANEALQQAKQALQQADRRRDQMDVVRADWMAQAQREAAAERARMQQEMDATLERQRTEMDQRIHNLFSLTERELRMRVVDAASHQAAVWIAQHLQPSDQQKQMTRMIASLDVLRQPTEAS